MFISLDTKHVMFPAIQTLNQSTKHHNAVSATFQYERLTQLFKSVIVVSFVFLPVFILSLSLPPLPLLHSPSSTVSTNLRSLELCDLEPMEQQVGC